MRGHKPTRRLPEGTSASCRKRTCSSSSRLETPQLATAALLGSQEIAFAAVRCASCVGPTDTSALHLVAVVKPAIRQSQATGRATDFWRIIGRSCPAALVVAAVGVLYVDFLRDGPSRTLRSSVPTPRTVSEQFNGLGCTSRAIATGAMPPRAARPTRRANATSPPANMEKHRMPSRPWLATALFTILIAASRMPTPKRR